MIQIVLHRNFIKSFDKRIKRDKKLSKQVEERTNLFKINPQNPKLKDHRLVGKMIDLRSFSINGDMVIFLDIGSHNQVY